jgi:hypothetical protein
MTTWNSASSYSRDRMLIAAVWIISLGTVFLVQQYFEWSWTEAWPLWVLFVGVGSLGSAIFGRAQSALGIWGIWWPLAVIAVGAVLLLSTTGNLALAPDELVSWWPVAIIGIGVWFLIGAVIARPTSAAQAEHLSIPLAGLSEAAIKLNFGGGELIVGQAEPGKLVSGTFEGGVRQRGRGVGRLELEPFTDAWPMLWNRPLHWQVGLTSEIPVSLELHTGANRSSIDLSALRLRRLELHTGASETRVRLPGSGATEVRAEAGLASLVIEVPQGVAARIRSRMAIGSTTVDETRFPRTMVGWVSPDYDTAANRVDIDVAGGLGSIKVV